MSSIQSWHTPMAGRKAFSNNSTNFFYQYKFCTLSLNKQITKISIDIFCDSHYATFENYTGVYRRAEIIPCKMHVVNSDDTTHWYLLLDTQTFDWPTARPATTNKHGKHTTHCISSHILSLFTKYKYTDNIYSISSITTAMTLLSLTY